MSQGTRIGWLVLVGIAIATRLASSLWHPILRGYDSVGHVSYVFFLDLYRAVPFADQGWSYFHPPLHYALGWLLAQSGNAGSFVRGLSLWGGFASLASAGLAAWIVHRGLPQPRGLAWLAFACVAFMPVHLYTSPMPGNELTATLLISAAIAHHVTQRSGAPLMRDLGTGLLVGLALLAKYNGAIALLAIAGQLGLRAVRPGLTRAGRRRLLLRGAVISSTAFLVCGGYYARNAAEFGTPFPLAGMRPVVDAFERGQPPGQRSVSDLVRISPQLFVDPDPRAPHMLHSIWGTTWAGMWVHLDPQEAELSPTTIRALLALGVLPTLLAGWGFLLALRRVVRDPDAQIEATLVALSVVVLAAFALFAYRIPTFAALKAMYLLSLSPAWAYFIARAVLALGERRRLQRLAIAGALLPLAFSAYAYTGGPALARAAENVGMARVYSHFGTWGPARAIYRRELARALAPPAPGTTTPRLNAFWLREMLAAVELESGRFDEAVALYRESVTRRAEAAPAPGSMGANSPFVLNRLAVAEALSGNPLAARALIDSVIEETRLPEFLTSRAALRAQAGDTSGAERDVHEALELEPELAPALETRARLRGDPSALASALRAASSAPRGYPYGVGDGRGLNTQLPMLVWRDPELALYRPARARP